MTEALSECSPDFAGADVRLSFAGSDELAAQIRQGVEARRVRRRQHEAAGCALRRGPARQPVEFATNTLVLAVPEDSEIDSVEDLDRVAAPTIAIGSESVPIGSYTREVLAKLPARPERRRSSPTCARTSPT